MHALGAVSTRAAFGFGANACQSEDRGRGRAVASLWFSYGGQNRIALGKLVDRFNASHPTLFIVPVFQGDYYEGIAKLRLGIAAGKPPALTHVIGEIVPYLVEAGVLERLDAFPDYDSFGVIPELGQERSFAYPDAHQARAAELYALPFNRSTPIAYANASLFEKLDLEPPTTWDELRSVASAFAKQQPNGIRFGFGSEISWWFWLALVNQAGGEIVDRENRTTLGGEAGIEAIRFWQTLVHVDRTMKPPPGRDANATEIINQDFLAGRLPLIWTSTAFLKYFEDNAAFPVKAVPLPKHRRYGTPTGGTHFVIVKSAPAAEKEVAWQFLHWMMQPEQVAEWSVNTGYLPTTFGAVRLLEDAGFYRKNPNYRVAYDQLAVAAPLPWSADLFRVQREIIQPRLERAVLTGDDAAQVLGEALAELHKG